MSDGWDDRQVLERTRLPAWAGYPITVLLEGALTAGLVAVQPYLPLGGYPILYVILIMAVAYWIGLGPAILAFFLGLLAFDYFFVPPLRTVLWPPASSPTGWAMLAAFFLGTAVVGFAMVIIRGSQRRTLGLARELRRSNERLGLATEVLTRLNQQTLAEDTIGEILGLIKKLAGAEAAGIRLRQAGDFPYCALNGYSESFLETENLVCIDWETGKVVLDEEGRAVPQCMCGIVLRGRTDPTHAFFTPGGSFWTNSTTELLAGGLRERLDEPLRGRCAAEGYESLAIIPLKLGDEVLGLFHIADKRQGRFSLDLIEFLEGIGASIGVALARKEADEHIRDSEARFALAQSAAEVGTWDWDLPADAAMLSDNLFGLYGLPAADRPLRYDEWLLLIHPDDRERVDRETRRCIQDVAPYDVEFRIVWPDESVHWLVSRGMVITDDDRHSVRMLGVSFDITERRQAEEAVRKSEESLNRTQRIAHLGSWELDLVNNRLLWSDEVYRIFGLEPQEFGATYEAFLEAVHADDRAAVDEAYSGSLREARDTYEIEHRVVRKSDGDVRIVQERCEHIRDESGRIIRSIGMVHDITERKHAEKTIQRQFSLLQEALVPSRPATGDGHSAAAVYVPAYPGEQIGGDFYDVFRTEGGRIGIVIGDVAGKGVEAAALAAAARSTVRAFAYELASPGAAMTHTNAVVQAQEGESAIFVTVFLATIDTSTGALSYAGAGHPPPAILRADGSVEFLVIGNPAVGVFAGREYETSEDRLEPGDTIVMYTDGITEARRGGEFFEIEGIQRALATRPGAAADEVAARLLDAAREWAGGDLRDDIAILAVQRAADVSVV